MFNGIDPDRSAAAAGFFPRSCDMNQDELKNLKADKVVDARGMACPGPLLEAKKAIGSVKVGEVVEIWSGDSKLTRRK